MGTDRQCSKCKRVDPPCGFTPDSFRAQCRECVRSRMKSWDQSRKDQDPIGYAKLKHDRYLRYDRPGLRGRHIRKTYGLTEEQVSQIFENQEGLCAICSTLMEVAGRGRNRACIDHDHETGRVRGLLCGLCNVGLGCLRDSPQLLRNATQYLDSALVPGLSLGE